MTVDPQALARVIAAIGASRKYAPLCEATTRRAAARALAGGGSERDVVRRAKARLHQVHGACLAGWSSRKADRILAGLSPGSGTRDTCRAMMQLHAATRERLPILDQFYPAVFAVTGVPASVLDLACGLHPFGLPWMDLPHGARYLACETDRRLVDLLNRFFSLLGVRARAEWRDVLAQPVRRAADLAFLTKAVPCLEQQEAGSSVRLLQSIDARHLVVSFPTQTLGGKQKGMRQHYARTMEAVLARLDRASERLDWPTELVYILTRP
jgi:16S rRNA (guanine(1405)-N(7))-methyltransferase